MHQLQLLKPFPGEHRSDIVSQLCCIDKSYIIHFNCIVITFYFLPYQQPTTNDNFGGRNNVINVKKSDFEVFQALESDASASIGSAGSISELLARIKIT